MTGNNTTNISGNVTGSSVVTGSNNTVTMTGTTVTLTDGADVDIKAALADLRTELAALGAPKAKLIDMAAAEAELLAEDGEVEKDKIGGAVERMVTYAKDAEGFSANIEKIASRLTPIASWLGEHGAKVLALAGIGVAG